MVDLLTRSSHCFARATVVADLQAFSTLQCFLQPAPLRLFAHQKFIWRTQNPKVVQIGRARLYSTYSQGIDRPPDLPPVTHFARQSPKMTHDRANCVCYSTPVLSSRYSLVKIQL